MHEYEIPKSFNIKRILRRITCITPRLHRTTFSGDYSLQKFSKIGKLYYDRNYHKESIKFSNQYTKRAFMQTSEGNFACYFSAPPYMPNCCIQIPDTNRNLLKLLGSAMPNFKLTSAEYCIDIFCKNPDTVSDLFYLLNRYISFPYAKEIYRAGGDFDGWDEPKGENSVFKAQYSMPQRRFTIYERGPDKRKQKFGWDHAFVDRVRMEANFNQIHFRS
jgi:hypothetical protein